MTIQTKVMRNGEVPRRFIGLSAAQNWLTPDEIYRAEGAIEEQILFDPAGHCWDLFELGVLTIDEIPTRYRNPK